MEDADCGNDVWFGECNFVPNYVNTETRTSEMNYKRCPWTKEHRTCMYSEWRMIDWSRGQLRNRRERKRRQGTWGQTRSDNWSWRWSNIIINSSAGFMQRTAIWQNGDRRCRPFCSVHSGGKESSLFLMFCWPCFVIYVYNKNVLLTYIVIYLYNKSVLLTYIVIYLYNKNVLLTVHRDISVQKECFVDRTSWYICTIKTFCWPYIVIYLYNKNVLLTVHRDISVQ